MDLHIRDNLKYLKGESGVPTIESGLIIDNTDGDEYLKLPLLATAECATVLNAAGEVAYDEATNRIKMYGAALNSMVTTADVDDAPADGATTDPISSNWAYDHAALTTAHGAVSAATASKIVVRDAEGQAAFAAPEAAGDALIKGTAVTITEMAALTTGKMWRGVANRPSEVDVSIFTLVKKTADQTVNNSTVLVNDTELLLAVGATDVWYIYAFLYPWSASADSDMDYAFAVPASGVVLKSVAWSATTPSIGVNGTAEATLAIAAANYVVQMAYIYIGGGTAGNLQLQWAQNAARAEDTKMRAGSCFVAFQII